MAMPTDRLRDAAGGRLNLLLTYGGWRDEPAVRQLPTLLAPMGIASMTADSGEEAAEMIQEHVVHVAVVDLALPLRRGGSGPAGGERILQVLRRIHEPPPTIVLRARQASQREHARGLARSLQEGAFTVVDRPVRLEMLLDALRRVVARYYANRWPRAQEALARSRWNIAAKKEEE